MVERVYVTADNKATLICPQCNKSTTADVSKFATMRRTVKIKSNCTCGHKWTSVLEKRRKYRKPVNLSGTYDHVRQGKIMDRGGMRVLDLSFDGVKIKLNVERSLQTGDHLNLEFYLDDSKNTLIRKSVTVRNVSGDTIGATFRSSEAYDPALGFYLMAEKRSGEDRRANGDRRTGEDTDYNGPEKRTPPPRRNGEDRRVNGENSE